MKQTKAVLAKWNVFSLLLKGTLVQVRLDPAAWFQWVQALKPKGSPNRIQASYFQPDARRSFIL